MSTSRHTPGPLAPERPAATRPHRTAPDSRAGHPVPKTFRSKEQAS